MGLNICEKHGKMGESGLVDMSMHPTHYVDSLILHKMRNQKWRSYVLSLQ